jgi:hypothetical protein
MRFGGCGRLDDLVDLEQLGGRDARVVVRGLRAVGAVLLAALPDAP